MPFLPRKRRTYFVAQRWRQRASQDLLTMQWPLPQRRGRFKIFAHVSGSFSKKMGRIKTVVRIAAEMVRI